VTSIAAIQMCSSGNVDDNLVAAKKLIQQAAAKGAKLLVLPENFAVIGNADSLNKLDAKEKFGSGKIQSFLSEQAKQNKVWIVGGTIPVACDDNQKVRAACLVYDDQGNVAARYDKIHLFDVVISDKEFYKESATTQAGNKVVVVNTPVGKLGVIICYDIRFPELARCLFDQGAEIIAIPAAFTVTTGQAHWELLCRSRAVENFSYVIGAAQGGHHVGGRSTYGHSLIVGPWGKVLAEKPDIIPGVIYADVDLKQLHDIRKSVPVDRHRKIFFDLSKLGG
jgi:predicted amidohydrolase